MKTKLCQTSLFGITSRVTTGFDYLTNDTITAVRFASVDGQIKSEPFAEAVEVVFELEESGQLVVAHDAEVEVSDTCLMVTDESGNRFEFYLFCETPLDLLPIRYGSVEHSDIVVIQLKDSIQIFLKSPTTTVRHIQKADCVEPIIDQLTASGYIEVNLT